MNDYYTENEHGLCATCSSYVLCMTHSEAAEGEWGACAMFKKIVEWSHKCDKWWNVKDGTALSEIKKFLGVPKDDGTHPAG